MPLIPTQLGSALGNMSPIDVEATAIQTFATDFVTYFSGASILGVPANPAALSAAKAAMIAALTGFSQPNAAATAIQTAITAFWGQVATLAPSIWVGTPGPVLPGVIPPPGLSGIAAAVQGIFSGNTSGGLPLADAANQIATAIHPTQLGAIATVLMPSVPAPIPTPTPII